MNKVFLKEQVDFFGPLDWSSVVQNVQILFYELLKTNWMCQVPKNVIFSPFTIPDFSIWVIVKEHANHMKPN